MLRSQFSNNNFPEYLSMTSSYFCRIADLPHLLPIYRSSRSQIFIKQLFLYNASGGCVWIYFLHAVAVAWKCSLKRVFLEISKNSQENTKKRKKRPWYTGFPVNFIKFITNLFSRRLFFSSGCFCACHTPFFAYSLTTSRDL